MDPQKIKTWQPWFFAAAALEAGAAAFALARVPSEGLSLARLAMFLLLGLAGAGALYCTFRSLRSPRGLERLERERFALAAGLLALLLAAGIFLLRYALADDTLDPTRTLPVFERLSPLLFFLLLVSVQTSLYLLAATRGLHTDGLSREGRAVRGPWGFFALLLGALLLLVAVTRLGVTPDPAYWAEPGIAIQGWQFALALIIGGAAFMAGRSARRGWVYPVLIYLAAVAIWLSVPNDVLKNAFYMTIGPPDEQPYPFSDSYYYDSMAQSLFIGHPYRGEIPTRPLYITLLALLHQIFGQRYDLILVGQTLVLGFIPVLFYWLGERLHSRAAGAAAACFFIFRELTSILVSSETRTSNTRMLLVDLPTLMLVLLACLLAFRWLERRDAKSALAAGGGFGLLLLLRTQSFLILPILLLIAALTLRPFGRSFLRLSGYFLAGLALVVVPWLLHNYLLTGQVSLDAAFQYKVIASQYAYTGNLDINNFDFEGKGVGQVLVQFLLKDPGFVLGFIANHFLAGWIGGLLALPLIEPFNGLFAPINLYWTQWNGHLAWHNLALVVVYLGVIALGLAAAWRRWRWAGLLPLGFSLGYALATAVGRFSGWRYDMPADWMPYFYFGIGSIEVVRLAGVLFGSGAYERTEEAPIPQSARWGELLPLGGLFVLLGALPWIATSFAAPRFEDQSAEALLPRLAEVTGAPEQGRMEAFLRDPDAVMMDGRLLYPRYFYREAGLSSATESPAYAPRDFPRQGFLVLNQSLTHALFPTREPLDFPQAGEVLLLGCKRDGYVEARLVAFPELDTAYVSDSFASLCR